VGSENGTIPCVKAVLQSLPLNNLSKAGWSWGCVSALDRKGRTIWIVDAHGYGKRFIVRADEMLTAFLELGSAIRLYQGIHAICGSMIFPLSQNFVLTPSGRGGSIGPRQVR
jgi:hypothetical protein